MKQRADVAVVGAGAAGLMAGIAAAQAGARVVALDSQKKLGAKILVSGGGRCNVTNDVVSESHFHGGSRDFIRRVLQRFPARAARAFFEARGVPLKLEPTGKLFPVSDSARDVLNALLEECRRLGVQIWRGAAVEGLERSAGGGYQVRTAEGALEARGVVLCTGGLALPRSGSNGAGYGLASRFGHGLVPTSPALTPLTGGGPELADLSGITLPVTLRFHPRQGKRVTYTGSFLFTHFGYSGPAALNLSRHWIRESWQDSTPPVRASFLPDLAPEEVNGWLLDSARAHPRLLIPNLLSQRLPKRLAHCLALEAGLPEGCELGRMPRPQRVRLLEVLTDLDLRVRGHLGYGKAEATAGGIPLEEVEVEGLESRLAPGLFFAGEILDVDGMLGGYNFQWAWSSGVVAGRAAARRALDASPAVCPAEIAG